MTTVRGQLGIFTERTARRDYRCNGWYHTDGDTPVIHSGDRYFRSALPPHSEIGNEGWETMRLCCLCAPNELTHPTTLTGALADAAPSPVAGPSGDTDSGEQA